jgi:hypothetical protein
MPSGQDRSGQGCCGLAGAQKTNNKSKSIGRIRFMAGSYHFVIAVWRTKRAESAGEILGTGCRQTQRGGLELWIVSPIDFNGRTDSAVGLDIAVGVAVSVGVGLGVRVPSHSGVLRCLRINK